MGWRSIRVLFRSGLGDLRLDLRGVLQVERHRGEALLDADAERVRLVDRHFAEQLAQPRNDAVRNTLVEPGETHDRVAILMHHLVDQMRSEEHTSELQSLMRISYAVFCLKKKSTQQKYTTCS